MTTPGPIPPYTTLPDELARVWRLGWPVSVGFGAIILMGAVDTLMVGALGKSALAAAALGNLWSISLAIFGHAGVRALDPIVAQAFGAGDREAAGRALIRGWVVAVILALPVMWGHTWAAEGLRMLGQPEHLLADAAAYATLRALGMPFAFAFDATRQFLQGLGVMRTATGVAIACNLLNVVANAVLIFGIGGWGGMGMVGSGLATAISMFALCFGLVWASWPVLRAWWPEGPGVLAPRPVLSLLWDALPVGLQTALEVWAFNGAGVMMGWLGESAVAANVAALQLASLAFTLPFGISAAAATRVGNLVGARLPWGRSAFSAVGLGASVMIGGALCFSLFPERLALLFNRDPETVAITVQLLPIAAAFALFDGTQVVAFGALRGAGDIRVPTLANVLGFWLLGLPVGYYLAFELDMGPQGVWLGLTLGLVSVSALLLARLGWLVRTFTPPPPPPAPLPASPAPS